MITEIKCYADDPLFCPTRAHPDDAGLDLRVAESVDLRPGESGLYSTGVRIEIPKGHVGQLAMRSSMSKRMIILLNGIGVIDSGYTGYIKLALANVGREAAHIDRGERAAQLLIVPAIMPAVKIVPTPDELGHTERGDGGFGSTGTR